MLDLYLPKLGNILTDSEGGIYLYPKQNSTTLSFPRTLLLPFRHQQQRGRLRRKTHSLLVQSRKSRHCLQAREKIAIAKVLAPRAVLGVLDQAIQVHGGGGVSNDFPLARLWAGARTLRLADGPDEVHLLSIAKSELARLAKPVPKL